MTHTGKIGSLPEALRGELNLRLLNGELSPDVLPWLNALPEVQALMLRRFDGTEITGNNLSAWKTNGYKQWASRRERIEHTRDMAKWSAEIAKAGGGSLSDGAAAILSGRIMEVLETLDDLTRAAHPREFEGGQAPSLDQQGEGGAARIKMLSEALEGLTRSVSQLRKGDHGAENLKLIREKVDQSERALDLEQQKFQRTTCELFVTWSEDRRALDIASGGGNTQQKTEALGKLMFGDLWEPGAAKGAA